MSLALLVVAATLLVPAVALASTGGVGESRGSVAPTGAPSASATASPAAQVTAYVQRVYQDLVGRAPEAAGMSYWTGVLNSGIPRAAVAWALVTSDEYRSGVIGRMYQQYLGRASDAGGLAYWVGQVGAGLTFEQFQVLLLGSDEYFVSPNKGKSDPTHFVDAMYRDVLGRPVDAVGQNYFVGQLVSGTSTRADRQRARVQLRAPHVDRQRLLPALPQS